MVSSDFGKLDASRQRTDACACTAGAAPAARTPAMPARWMRDRRSMTCLLPVSGQVCTLPRRAPETAEGRASGPSSRTGMRRLQIQLLRLHEAIERRLGEAEPQV